MRRTWRRLSTAVLLSLTAACAKAGDGTQAAKQAPAALPEGHPPVGSGNAMAAQAPGGVVLETVDGGGYTYARLGAADQEIWVAGPVTALEVGDTVRLSNPMSMGTFTSKALNRTFDNLYFADRFLAPGEAAPAAPSPQRGAAPDAGDATVPATSQGVVAETMDSGGYTYARVTLDGKDVWLAGPQTKIAEGNAISWSGGMVMQNFTSNTLHRTFERILFVNRITVVTPG